MANRTMGKLKPIEHKFKALFFSGLKSFLSQRSDGTKRILYAAQMKKVLIFRPDRIGDMVITLPLVDGLKRHFPQLKMSILASPKNVALIQDDSRFEKIYLYKKNLLSSPLELKKIRNEKFDCIIDTVFEDSVTTLFLSHFCANGDPIIGMGKNKYAGYYDFNCENSGGHIIDNTLKLLGAFRIDSTKVSGYGELHLGPEAIEVASDFRKSFPSGKVVGLNLSSGAPTRVWPREKWVELTKMILTSIPESHIVLITIPAERHIAQEIKVQFKNRVHVIPHNLDIAGVSAIIKFLDILITPDTSLVHIARSFQVPVVGLYTGNVKNFDLWHPYGMKTCVARAEHEDNIFDIKVEQVFYVLESVMGARQEVKR